MLSSRRRRRRVEEGPVMLGEGVSTNTWGNCRLCWPCQSQFLLAAHFKAQSKQTLHPQCYMTTSPLPSPRGTYLPWDIHTKCMWPGFCLCASFAVQVNQQRRLQEAHANLAIVFGIEIGFGNKEWEIGECGNGVLHLETIKDIWHYFVNGLA